MEEEGLRDMTLKIVQFTGTSINKYHGMMQTLVTILGSVTNAIYCPHHPHLTPLIHQLKRRL